MRNLGLGMVMLLITSCSEEIITYIPGAEATTVLYGLINIEDTINYVRITKTFYGAASAYELAKDTCNLFYEDLSAKIQCWTRDSLYAEFPLTKTYILPDTTGIFQTPRNWVYAYMGYFPPIDSFAGIRVVVVLPEGDTVQTLKMTVFSKPKMVYPNKSTKTVSLYTDGALKVDIFHHNKVGIKMRINLVEMKNGVEISKIVEEFIYRISYSYFNITPGRFISILNENLEEDSDVEFRKIKSVDIFGYTAADALLFYNAIMGTEYDFTKSPYARYIENGIGLVLPYSVDSIVGLHFDSQTMDSLVNGEFTRKFKFVKWN